MKGLHLAAFSCGLAAALTVALLWLSEQFGTVIRATARSANAQTLAAMAPLGEFVMVVVTIVVTGIVAQLAFRAAIDEERRAIAVRRLLGARRGAERRRVLARYAGVGAASALVGAVLGGMLGFAGTRLLEASNTEWARASLPALVPVAVIPAIALVVTAVLAAWGATRAVLGVAPWEAVRGADVDPALGAARISRTAVVIGIVGVVLLAAGYALGLFLPLGVLPGVLGGALLAMSLVGLAAPLAMALLRALRPLLERSTNAKLTRSALERAPQRTGGVFMALLTGIAVTFMFGVAGASAERALLQFAEEADLLEEHRNTVQVLVPQVLSMVTAAVAVGGAIAVLGFMAAMLMSVRARAREFQVLRRTGMRRGLARAGVLLESALLSGLALVGGVLLGALLGWLGASMMLNSAGVFVVPVIPWPLLGILTLATVAIALLGALPARRVQ